MSTKPFNAYDVLSIKKNATVAQIKAAYRKIAKEIHPDLTNASGDAMASASDAKRVLLDPDQRKKHDAELFASEQRLAEEAAARLIRPMFVQRRQPQQPTPRRQHPTGMNLYQMGVQANMQQIARRPAQANQGAQLAAVILGLVVLNQFRTPPKRRRKH